MAASLLKGGWGRGHLLELRPAGARVEEGGQRREGEARGSGEAVAVPTHPATPTGRMEATLDVARV